MLGLTIREYSYADPATTEMLGLPAKDADDGICYGLLFCETDEGERVTVVTPDVAYWRMLRDTPAEARAGATLPAEKFPYRRDGWPDEWS